MWRTLQRAASRLFSTHWLILVLAAASLFAQQTGIHRDIEFGRVDGVSLTLDAYVPPGKGTFPAVILVHGGGWHAGDKQTYIKPLFEPLEKAGFVWFSINYRLAPRYPFPAAIEDVERAIEYVRTNARKYDVDRRRIALVGESAGGHIAAFVGTRSRHLAGVVSFYGVHDFESRARMRNRVDENVGWFLGINSMDENGIARMRAASPVHFVHRRMPPYLFIHGTEDKGVPFQQSLQMCDAMKKVGAVCEVYPVKGAGHGVENWEKEPSLLHYKAKLTGWLSSVFGTQMTKE
jgi:acetyl esterase